MKREDIEKAAGDYSGSSLGFTNNNSVMAKHKAFVDGAEWRINSVWHNMNETPKVGKIIILVNEEGQGVIILVFPRTDIKNLSITMKFVKWSYLDDLLPAKD